MRSSGSVGRPIPTILGALAAILPAVAAAQRPECEAPPFRGDAGLRTAPGPFARPVEPSDPSTTRLRAVGNIHLLVLLAEFSDLPHRIAPSRFDDLLFGPERSVRDYYEELVK